jgi:hypothetical protein
MILASHGIIGSSIVQAYDIDAQAFFDRVDTAGGSLSLTEKNAVNTLVIKMKDDGIWTLMKAIYPMVGASSAACSQNLKSSSFTGTFTAVGVIYDSNGITLNGSSGYMDSSIVPNVTLQLNSVHLSAYIRNNTGSGGAMGCADNSLANGLYLNPRFTNNQQFSRSNSNSGGGQGNLNSVGFWLSSRVSSTTFKIFKSNTTFATETITTSGRSANPIFVGAVQLANFGIEYSNRNIAFASIGDGLTDTEASNFYTAVQAFQTTLSRQV